MLYFLKTQVGNLNSRIHQLHGGILSYIFTTVDFKCLYFSNFPTKLYIGINVYFQAGDTRVRDAKKQLSQVACVSFKFMQILHFIT